MYKVALVLRSTYHMDMHIEHVQQISNEGKLVDCFYWKCSQQLDCKWESSFSLNQKNQNPDSAKSKYMQRTAENVD